jgi:hypothetical protein
MRPPGVPRHYLPLLTLPAQSRLLCQHWTVSLRPALTEALVYQDELFQEDIKGSRKSRKGIVDIGDPDRGQCPIPPRGVCRAGWVASLAGSPTP